MKVPCLVTRSRNDVTPTFISAYLNRRYFSGSLLFSIPTFL